MRNFWRAGVSISAEKAEKRWDTILLALCTGVVVTLFFYNRQPYTFASWLSRFDQPVYRTYEEYLLINCLLLLLPVAVLLSGGGRTAGYGAGVGNRWGWLVAGGCYLFMLPLLWWAAGRPDFQQTYPLYRMARYWLPALAYHELTYTFYLWCWELFFRGIFTSVCWRWLGWVGILLQAVAFMLLHVGKPGLEVAGSLVAGLVLGVLAVRAGSFLPGFACHALVSATMDLFVLRRTGTL